MLAFGMGGLADEDLFFMAVMPVIWIAFCYTDKKHGTFFMWNQRLMSLDYCMPK